MKAKFLIIAFLIFSLLGAFALKANAQDDTVYKSTKTPIPQLIADETTITYSKTGARVETYSEKVYDDILRVWEPNFKRVSISYKNEDGVIVKKWLIYLSRVNGINLQQWAKKHL